MKSTLILALIPIALFVACGGTVIGQPYGTDGGPIDPKIDGSVVDGSRPDGSIRPKNDGGGPDGGTQEDGGVFIDPKCPVPPPPVLNYECDVQNQTGCPKGNGCYAYVQYPATSCDAEEYGSVCFQEGTGTQGSACGGGSWCKAGYDCVISGGGTICAKHCDLNRPGSCPEGHVCQSTDVLNVGVCD